MSDADKTALLVAIVGLLSTALGGIIVVFGNIVTHYMNHKTDKNKLIAQKIEEIYDLSIDIKRLLNLEISNRIMIPLEVSKELIPYEKSYSFEIRNKLEIMMKISNLYYIKSVFKEVLDFKSKIAVLLTSIHDVKRIDTINFSLYMNDPVFTGLVRNIYFQIEEAHTTLCVALGIANIENPIELF
jgi:hypothetical protein